MTKEPTNIWADESIPVVVRVAHGLHFAWWVICLMAAGFAAAGFVLHHAIALIF